jgi:hypothetical protein
MFLIFWGGIRLSRWQIGSGQVWRLGGIFFQIASLVNIRLWWQVVLARWLKTRLVGMEVEGFCLFWWWRQVVFGRRLNRGMFLWLLVICGLGRQLGQASRDRFLDKLYAGLPVVLTGRGIACRLVWTLAGWWPCQNSIFATGQNSEAGFLSLGPKSKNTLFTDQIMLYACSLLTREK